MNIQKNQLTHEQREREVFDFFNGVIQEINSIFLKKSDNIDVISLRIQMITIFSLVDVVASYWCEYRNVAAGPRDRFVNWYNNFCYTDKNSKYRIEARWKMVDGDRMYELRSSLVHFFGLSGAHESVYLSLIPNSLSRSEERKLICKLTKLKKNITIKPKSFYILIKKGIEVMFSSWIENIEKANRGDVNRKNNHIDGIERIWKKIQQEGAIRVV